MSRVISRKYLASSSALPPNGLGVFMPGGSALSGLRDDEGTSLTDLTWPSLYQAATPQSAGVYTPVLSAAPAYSSETDVIGNVLYLGEIAAGLITFNAEKGQFDNTAPSAFAWVNLAQTVIFATLVPVTILAGIAELPLSASVALALVYGLDGQALGFLGVAVGGVVGFLNVIDESNSGHLTQAEGDFVGTITGVAVGIGALFLAPEELFGTVLGGLAIAVGTNLMSDAATAAYSIFLPFSGQAGDQGYFTASLQPIIDFRNFTLSIQQYAENALDQIIKAPSAASLVPAMSADILATKEIFANYTQLTQAEVANLAHTDAILNQIAIYYSVVNPGEAVVVGLTEALIAKYAISLGNEYQSVARVFQGILGEELYVSGEVQSDLGVLGQNPGNGGALSNAYGAGLSLVQYSQAAYKQIEEIIQASNANGASSSDFGLLTPSPSTNGTILGTTSADILIGGATAVTFDGEGATTGSNPGTDIEIGNSGADTFIFNSGYGPLVIDENAGTLTSTTGVLVLGTGITPSTLVVSATVGGGVLLTIGTSGDSVDIDNELNGAGGGIAEVEFSNGTTWTRAQLTQFAAAPTTGPNILYGTSASQTFNGLGGGDTIYAGGGNDSFIFDRGYGSLTIYQDNVSASPKSILDFGTGIAPTDIKVSVDNQGDLILTVLNSGTADGDLIYLEQELDSKQYGVQSVVFSNGTTWTYTQLLQFANQPTTGADILYLSSPGTINGLGGGDIIHGSGGTDTFIFDQGYGSLEIAESSGDNQPSTAVLDLGTGLSFGTMVVTSDGAGDLLLHFSSTDIVQLDGELLTTDDGVGKVIDSGGDTLTAAQLVAMEINPGATGQVIYGTTGANVFNNLGGGDIVVGSGGGDTLNYAAGAGALTVDEEQISTTGTNILILSGISSTQATFALTSGGLDTTNVVLTDGVTGDTITLTGMGSSLTDGVNKIKFLGNNVTLTQEQVVALATGTLTLSGSGTLTGGAGSNSITATAADTVINSAGIYDSITARSGHTTINLTSNSSGVGHDAMIILGGVHNLVNAVDGNISVSGVSNADTLLLGNGNSIVTGAGTGDDISVLTGNSNIVLGNSQTASTGATISVLSGGTVTLIGNSNQVTLGSGSAANSSIYGSTTVSVSGAGNSVTALLSSADKLGDTATSTATTFTLTSPLGGSVSVLGGSDMVFVSGGTTSINDAGQGTDIDVAQNSNLLLSGFGASGDASAVLGLLTDEGYSSLSQVIAALVSDGNGGSFLALGGSSGTGTGIDFLGTSVSQLTTYLESGTHIAFDTTFPDGLH